MTIASEAIVAGPFDGNGVNSEFSFSFKVFVDSDVLVKHVSAAGVESTSVLNTNYVVTRNADQDNNPGGSVIWRVGGITTALPVNETLTITSKVPNTQHTVLPSGGKWAAKVVEKMIDKVTILVKQVWRDHLRTIRQPITDEVLFVELPNAATRRGKYLYFEDTTDAQPSAVENLDISVIPVSGFMTGLLDDPDAATARATLGAIGGTVSGFMQTVLDDTTAEAARATLGVVTAVTGGQPHMNQAVGAALDASRADHVHDTQYETFIIACSDETTNITAGVAKAKFRIPYPMTIGAVGGVRASLSTAQPSGAIFTVDINENGVSILSTKLTIDNGEVTSGSAATPPVVSDLSLAVDSEISIDVDQVGTAGAKGLKVMIIARRTAP